MLLFLFKQAVGIIIQAKRSHSVVGATVVAATAAAAAVVILFSFISLMCNGTK